MHLTKRINGHKYGQNRHKYGHKYGHKNGLIGQKDKYEYNTVLYFDIITYNIVYEVVYLSVKSFPV